MPLVESVYLSSREAPIHTPDYNSYVQLMHYAEGSVISPILPKLYVSRLGEAGASLHPSFVSETANRLICGRRPHKSAYFANQARNSLLRIGESPVILRADTWL